MAGPSVPVQDRVVQHIPVAGPSAPIAGPSRSIQGRVGLNSGFQQEFQAGHNNQGQDNSLVGNQIHSEIGSSQHIIGWQEGYADGAPSVQIYLSCVDYIVTLYRLRRPSGRPPDYTTYTRHKGRRTNI